MMKTSGSGMPVPDPSPALRSQAILRRTTSAGPGHDSTDRAIVDAVLAGDSDAFRHLVERESASVVRAGHRILGDLHEAEDVAQEAFVTAYRLGGRYQFEGNAGGEILECDRPRRLRVSWVYGEVSGPADISEVVLRLAPAGDGATTFELEHTAIVPEEFWTTYGPGAVGVGWEGGLLGLALHLRGGSVGGPIAWQLSEEGRAFNTLSAEAWGAATLASGEDRVAVATMTANTTQFYAPDPES